MAISVFSALCHTTRWAIACKRVVSSVARTRREVRNFVFKSSKAAHSVIFLEHSWHKEGVLWSLYPILWVSGTLRQEIKGPGLEAVTDLHLRARIKLGIRVNSRMELRTLNMARSPPTRFHIRIFMVFSRFWAYCRIVFSVPVYFFFIQCQ